MATAHGEPTAADLRRAAPAGSSQPAAAAMTDTPPVVPARMTRELELGPACEQCGGMMQRTGTLLHVHVAAATTPAAADVKRHLYDSGLVTR